MLDQRDAILRLLRDDDEFTVRLVKDQLSSKGRELIPELKELLAIDDECVSRHVKEVIGQIDSREAAAELSALCPHMDDDADLERPNWLVARVFMPGIDIKPFRRELDIWAMRLTTWLRDARTPSERLGWTTKFIGEELGFRGNADDYYSPSNSLLPAVITNRTGIPITLTLIYMMIGRRAGMEIEGVNFPGHFLARHGDLLFDPFERGRILHDEECAEILERQSLELRDEHLEKATSVVMFRRILTNLLYVFQNQDDKPKAAMLADWIRDLGRS